MQTERRFELDWQENGDLLLGDTVLRCPVFEEPQSGSLQVAKPRDLIEATVSRLAEFRGGNIVELGINNGGSTALIASAAEPRHMVAIDINPEPVKPLEDFIASRQLTAVVSTHYGIDQADKKALSAIVDSVFDEAIDLVIDDASHVYGPTRSSFECLFPRLRSGGAYLIEDWRWEQHIANTLAHIWEGTTGPGEASPPPDRASRLVRALCEKLGPTSPDYQQQLNRLLNYLDYPGAYGSSDPEDKPYAPESLNNRIPLTRLAVELMLLRASSMDIVDEIVINQHWILVRRDTRELDPETFSLDIGVLNAFGQL